MSCESQPRSKRIPSLSSSSMPTRLAVLHAERAVVADLLDRVRDHAPDLLVAGRDRRHAGELLAGRDLLRLLVAQMARRPARPPARSRAGSPSGRRRPRRSGSRGGRSPAPAPSPSSCRRRRSRSWPRRRAARSSAPWFANVSPSSISPAIVTPSFVIVGAPVAWASTTLRPRGPSVTLTVSATASMPAMQRRARLARRTAGPAAAGGRPGARCR